MLFERTNSFADIKPGLDARKLIALAKRLLPDVVFNMASLEGNPFTFPEIQTLLDGITIGGHKLSDEQQIKDDTGSYKSDQLTISRPELR